MKRKPTPIQVLQREQRRIKRKCRLIERQRWLEQKQIDKELLERNKERLLHAQGKLEYRRGY